MPRNPMLKTPQFGIRTMLVETTLVALCLVGWRERTRYLREHLFVSVVDQTTGSLLPRFQYQTSIVTSETGEEKIWSQWRHHSRPNALTLEVPEYCRLEFRARALDVAGGYRQQEQSILVLPHLSHNTTLRLTEGKSFESFLIDSITGEPIRGARIVPTWMEEDSSKSPDFFQRQPYFDKEFETLSDSSGKFVVRNLSTAFAISAPKYQNKLVRFERSDENLERLRNSGIHLEPAVPIQGRIKCSETGDPIPDCDVVYDNGLFRLNSNRDLNQDEYWSQDAYWLQERSDFHLTTKTDQEGYFELFSDSDFKNCRVWFSKKGWFKKSIELSDCDDDIVLDPYPFQLVGTVVDESGEPVKEFEIKTYSNWTDIETYRFHGEKGSFRVTDNNPIVKFEVHAKNKGLFSKELQLNWAEEQPNEVVILPNGFEISGNVLGKASVPNGGQSSLRIDLKRITSKKDTYEMQYAGHAKIASTTAESDGSFHFSHIANGTYTLETTYFGHVVNKRPVVVDKIDVVVSPIKLPQLGRVRGKVRNEDGSDAPFHRTYITDLEGNPQKWFHTNHLGEFDLENVPCGRYGIGPKPMKRELVGCCICHRAWDIDGAVLVEPAQTTEFSYERFPLFEFQGLSPAAILLANDSITKHFSALEFDTFKTVKVIDSSTVNTVTFQLESQRQTKDHETFALNLSQDACQQSLTIAYRANRHGSANKVLFRPRQLKLHSSDADVPIEKAKPEVEVSTPSDDPFGDTSSKRSTLESELYVGKTSVFLLKQNRALSVVQSIGLQEIIPFHVLDDEPDTAIIHNTRFGWSRIQLKQPIDTEPKVHELKLEKGAEVLGKIKLAELPLMPDSVRIVDEQGASLTCDVEDYSKFGFQRIWPGKWRVQLLGYDPYLGERILAERELMIEGIDCHDVELGKTEAPLTN